MARVLFVALSIFLSAGSAWAASEHYIFGLEPSAFFSVYQDTHRIWAHLLSSPAGSLVFQAEGGGHFQVQEDGVSPDRIPPAPVTNLTVLHATWNQVELGWTATGDDGLQGQAHHYLLRRSALPITEENWDSAVPVPDLPTPQPAGAHQTVWATGLAPKTWYHFALRVVDEAGNESSLSNDAIGETTTEPPIYEPLDPAPRKVRMPAGGLGIYPNPTRRTMQIYYSLQTGARVSLRLFDATGRRIGPELLRMGGPGLNLWTLDLDRVAGHPLPAGVYWIHLQDGPTVRRERLLVLPGR